MCLVATILDSTENMPMITESSMHSSGLKDTKKVSALFFCPQSPSQRRPCCQSPLCAHRSFFHMSKQSVWMQISFVLSRKDFKHGLVPGFPHLVNLRDDYVSVWRALLSFVWPHSPQSPGQLSPPHPIATLLGALLGGPALFLTNTFILFPVSTYPDFSASFPHPLP